MILNCPRCKSPRIAQRRFAGRVASLLGTVSGAVGAVLPALEGAELGLAVGALAGPSGAVVRTVCGAALAGLAGGTAGCLVGTRLGHAIDEHLIDRFECLDCGHTFSRVEVASPRFAAADAYGDETDDDA